MKTSTWIKIIGILCIIFGTWGIFSYGLGILLTPNIPEISGGNTPQVQPEMMAWFLRLTYIGFVVNVIYAVAGILFLSRKPISIKFMFAALAISILYVIVPIYFLGHYPATMLFNYKLTISNLTGPFIDIILIAAVIRLSKYYFIPDPENTSRKPLTHKQLRAISLIGVLCLFIPVSFVLLWLYAFNSEATWTEKVDRFESYFPGFLHGNYTITLVGIALCAMAILLSSIGLQSIVKSWKVLNIMVLSFSILMLLMNLFSLM